LHTDFVSATYGHSLWAMFFGALVLLGATQPRDRLLIRLLAHPALRIFGKYGYGLYVWHYIVLSVLRSVGFTAAAAVSAANSQAVGHAAFIGVNFLLTACMTALSWCYLEKPALALRDRMPITQTVNTAAV